MTLEKDFPLHPVPDSEWQAEFDRLMHDKYLSRKYDRQRRLVEHRQYIDDYCPEIMSTESGLVVDLGPGAGEMLEFARKFGHSHLGIDAESSKGGMGKGYLKLSKMMHQRQGLEVNYMGGHAFFRKLRDEQVSRDIVLLSARGAWAQCWSKFVGGPPHHLHHDCNQQWWNFGQPLTDVWRMAFRAMAKHLRPGGHVLIVANRLGGQTGQKRYSKTIIAAAEKAGLETVKAEDNYIHKWRKAE